ncbi:MAG TPA: PHB depolymerase family esterase [Steroidobacteraceae bacterium]|nr:PHB depolymerase family esterase [Steroidobacteraceae bacterium]
MKYALHIRIGFATIVAVGSLLSDAAAKNVACVAARGRSSYKVESRCMNLQQGDVRTYRIYTPRTPPKTLMPLILVLHGGGGSGSAMEGLALGQFNRIADKHNVIVVYPDGVGRSWNDGRSDLRSKAVKEGVDDVAFLRAVVDDVGRRFNVDRKRIYATGISNGGLMSYRLACDASDFITAVAPVAANLSAELSDECRPMRAVPIAIFNGTDDPMMPWLGGDIKVLWSRRGEVLSAQETFERFIKLGDCALPVTHPPRNRAPNDGTSVVRHVARDCNNGGEVRLYEILGGGHTWPGGSPYLTERIVGKVSHKINASDEIWNFVKHFSLP